MARPITDETAQTLRAAWFDYLDAVEPLRAPLHAYGRRLTGNVWDAEDLVQETLLKGFGMIGRGDLHGSGSPVANVRAYLFRTATHLWIDAERRRVRERAALAGPQPEPALPAPEMVRDAGERLFAGASPQARAAVVLKDAFDFTLEEIADLLRTTVGGVKSALRRGRAALRAPPADRPAPPRALIDAFVDAYNARDLDRLLAAVTADVSIEVLGVGGGRGLKPGNGWTDWVLSNPVRAEAHRLDGEDVVAIIFETADGPRLCEILRLEGEDGCVARIVDYCFAADTMAWAAAELGREALAMGYRQDDATLETMIATTTRPWDSPGAAAPAPPAP